MSTNVTEKVGPFKTKNFGKQELELTYKQFENNEEGQQEAIAFVGGMEGVVDVINALVKSRSINAGTQGVRNLPADGDLEKAKLNGQAAALSYQYGTRGTGATTLVNQSKAYAEELQKRIEAGDTEGLSVEEVVKAMLAKLSK